MTVKKFVFNLHLIMIHRRKHIKTSLHCNHLSTVRSLRENLKLRPCNVDREIARLIQQGRGDNDNKCFFCTTLGVAKRKCLMDGVWGYPDYGECIGEEFNQLQEKV